MRAQLRAVALSVAMGACLEAQLRPGPDATQTIQKQSDEFALKKAEELAGRSKTILGGLNREASVVIRRWDEAVRLWKKEPRSGADALLAEGVLFDCLGRLRGVVTRVLSSERPVPYFADLAAQRPGRAVKAFDAALKLDPRLNEARMRAARIRAPGNREAALTLEQMANDQSGYPFSYLSAMSRAETSRGEGDAGRARHWYQRALELNPRSTAATIALGSLGAAGPVSFGRVDPSDIYYSYPCTVLTPEVDAALSARVQRVVVK